jgi:hypothetical protein
MALRRARGGTKGKEDVMRKSLLGTMLVALAAGLPAAAAAQSTTGMVVGRVTDQATGKPVAGARVAMTSPSWIEQWVVTDSGGNYVVAQLPPGHYELTVQSAGYDKASFGDLQVNIDWTIRENVALQAARTASAPSQGEVVAGADTRTE